ncbi:hypothetical protein L596_001521 [Steinernema carpocapsae]|uniref:Uncharacterized protein n=1 Tax=Steinernema carpocapsae TaxID=34508 RepID=A0A4U8ULA9_STECR|nr:hypothetical protein L596_001521 [Steinernema carpocapsae]
MSTTQTDLCDKMIDAYIKEYDYKNETVELTMDQQMHQLVWDAETQADCYKRNAPICLAIQGAFHKYLADKDGSHFILNKKNEEKCKCKN